MKVLSIEIIEEIAIQELKDMEKRNLIKLNNVDGKLVTASQKFWGKLSDTTTKKLHKHIEKSRDEWSTI